MLVGDEHRFTPSPPLSLQNGQVHLCHGYTYIRILSLNFRFRKRFMLPKWLALAAYGLRKEKTWSSGGGPD